MFRCPKIQFRSKLCVTCIRSLPNLSHRCAFGAQLLTVIGFASLTPLFESEGGTFVEQQPALHTSRAIDSRLQLWSELVFCHGPLARSGKSCLTAEKPSS